MRLKPLTLMLSVSCLASCGGDEINSSSSLFSSAPASSHSVSSMAFPSSEQSSAEYSSGKQSSSAISSSAASSVNAIENNTITLEEGQVGYCNTLSVPVDMDHDGFNGDGYANTVNAIGAGLSWSVIADTAGSASINVRFANGGGAPRSGTLLVNNGADGAYPVVLSTTGAWASWQNTSVIIQLQGGVNTLSLVADTANGLANIDSISIIGPGVTGVDCAETPPPSPPTVEPDGETLAFPGAMGFGRYAIGGRGGQVVHVTNLNDSGSGSLRDAISQPNRIVVFDVGGVIRLNSRLIFKKNQTIAGQTAPGDGIVLYGQGTSFSGASNTIVRYLRFRMGRVGTSGQDSVAIANGTDIIFDHVSISWGRDGNYDINPDNKGDLGRITLQNSIVAQGLANHSTGGLMDAKLGSSVINTLYIDNWTRNVKARGTVQWVNNVVYNWGDSGYMLGFPSNCGSAYDSGVRFYGQMLGSVFISGPLSKSANDALAKECKAYEIFAQDNWLDGDKNGAYNPRQLTGDDYGLSNGNITWLSAANIDYPPVSPLAAQDALNHIIANAGASKVRDPVDTLLINELKSYGTKGAKVNGTWRGIENENELGLPNVVGNIAGGNAPVDTDRDGMPDTWEAQNGLDPSNANDAMQDADGDGWVNVEEYINSLAP